MQARHAEPLIFTAPLVKYPLQMIAPRIFFSGRMGESMSEKLMFAHIAFVVYIPGACQLPSRVASREGAYEEADGER